MKEQQGEIPRLTRAKWSNYKEFFDLFAKYVDLGKKEGFGSLFESKGGVIFLPLGFIPGDAIVLRWSKSKGWQRVDANPGARAQLSLPPDFIEEGKLPPLVKRFLAAWREMAEALGGNPSPMNFGLAKRLLNGQPPNELRIGFTNFRFRDTDPEAPFGVSLRTDWGGIVVEHIFCPKKLPYLPKEGVILSLDKIIEGGKNPLAKLIRTSAKMEGWAMEACRNHSEKAEEAEEAESDDNQ